MSTKDLTGVQVYDSTSIKVLEGLEPLRLRPAMYIGSTGDSGLHHLVYEVVDNSVDEALAGIALKSASRSMKTIRSPWSTTAPHPGRSARGRGCVRCPGRDDQLHAGGKFDSNSYKVSGGLHALA